MCTLRNEWPARTICVQRSQGRALLRDAETRNDLTRVQIEFARSGLKLQHDLRCVYEARSYFLLFDSCVLPDVEQLAKT